MLKIGNYFREKTIKLSDSYRCMIYNNDTDAVDCIQCIGFTCPKILQYNEEVYKYGNLAQKFLIPKFDVVHEFTIDFFESFDTNAISITSEKISLSNWTSRSNNSKGGSRKSPFLFLHDDRRTSLCCVRFLQWYITFINYMTYEDKKT